MNDNQDHLHLLRKIKSKPKSTQRELADELGFSLGKLNYCLKALKTKGLVKKNKYLEVFFNNFGGKKEYGIFIITTSIMYQGVNASLQLQ